MQTTKPTFLDIRRIYNRYLGTVRGKVTAQDVAVKAGVQMREEYAMEVGGMVSRESARKILQAFHELTGCHYTVEDVHVLFPHASCHDRQKPIQ